MSLNCSKAVSKLKAYQQQHQDLKQQFSDFLSQSPFLPDVKWDEPFMSSPYYKNITEAPKNIFDNLYDAKEEARKQLEELKELANYPNEQTFLELTLKQKLDYLLFRCFKPTQDPDQEPRYQQPIPDLRRYELEFLYDNYQDEELAEIITQRDQNADMLKIFDCTPNQIVHNQQELQQAIQDKKEIKAYVGELFPNFFQVLPQNIEYIYTKFPEVRIRKMKITIGGQSKEELIEEMKSQFTVSDDAESMLNNPDFTVSPEKENLTLIFLKLADNFRIIDTVTNIFKEAKKLGLELCPAETGPQLRKHYLEKSPNEFLRIGMKSIRIGQFDWLGFGLKSHEGKLYLDGVSQLAYSNNFWNEVGVFRLPKSET